MDLSEILMTVLCSVPLLSTVTVFFIFTLADLYFLYYKINDIYKGKEL